MVAFLSPKEAMYVVFSYGCAPRDSQLTEAAERERVDAAS